jgi:hypothetical protein
MGEKYNGAWLTDIDDTLVESGVMPDKEWINWLSEKLQVFKKYNIVWVPMSGVALVKLGPRILYRLPEELVSGILYYGGDGSELYYYDEEKKVWSSDSLFQIVYSDAQGIAVIGKDNYTQALSEKENLPVDDRLIRDRISKAVSVLEENNYSADFCILDILKKRLSEHGYNPDESETYFRGGSVSWMMLGDTSALPYKTKKADKVRMELISLSEEILLEYGSLESIGNCSIHIPFHGARGIKFVLKGNDKERGTRDLVERKNISPDTMVFAGNELFAGGNDNMIRNVDGVTLLSVGEKTDFGKNVFYGGLGIEANRKWMDKVCDQLEEGLPWNEILKMMNTAEVLNG